MNTAVSPLQNHVPERDAVVGHNTGFRCEIDKLSQADWNSLLTQFSDAVIHQSATFGSLRWGADKISSIILYEHDQPVAVAQLAIVSMPLLGAGIAHCKFGPLWRRRGQPERLEIYLEMLNAMRAEYAVRRGLLLRLKPWELPATSGQLSMLRQNAGFAVQPHMPMYHTFVIDTSRSIEQLRAGFHSKWRYNLKKAEQQALTITRSNDAAAAETFMQLYGEMRDIKSFVDTSEIDLLPGLIRELPEALRPSIFIARSDGKPVAAIVISLIGETAYYLFGATANEGRESGASYVLFWQAICWLKEANCRWFDLVGSTPQGTGGGAGYRRFKAGMTADNGDEYHMADWEVSSNWRSYVVVHGGTRLRALLRDLRHGFNGIRERLLNKPG